MHPAYSVIVFTTASGAGYGLLVLLCLLGVLDALPRGSWFGVAGFALAYALVTGGLLSSSVHLGHPERAWRAFSQWRSSWLSREGVAAIFTYLPSGLFAIGWVLFAARDGLWAAFGVLGALSALVTLYCTAMIYASLKTIRQWHNPWVVAGYLLLGLASGALWLAALAACFGAEQPHFAWLAVVGLLLGLLTKLGYWNSIDKGRAVSDAGTATGLGRFGAVSLLAAPHTHDNYVLREMGYRVARKHSRRLRIYAVASGFLLPLLASLLTLLANEPLTVILALLALLSAMLGLLIERWLFFAEATHVVMLYYGADKPEAGASHDAVRQTDTQRQ